MCILYLIYYYFEDTIVLKMNNGEEYELLDDPKYRSYISQVEKCLKNFENTAEWADLISTLGKLNKV